MSARVLLKALFKGTCIEYEGLGFRASEVRHGLGFQVLAEFE